MNKPAFILGFIAAVTGALTILIIIPAQHIPPMMSSVSPDFYPYIGTTIFLIGGIGLILTSFGKETIGIDTPKILQAFRFSMLMVLLFSTTLIAFYFINFIVGGIILIAASMWFLGERRPQYIVSVSLISPILIWLFIDVLLDRSLP